MLNASANTNLPKYQNSGMFNASSKMSEDIGSSDHLSTPTGNKSLLKQGPYRKANLH